ncbi:MAG: hypothetical protein U0W40_19830 [Acidimicrobiia bacterium]
MTRWVAARRRGESERGASLVIALAMIMIISVAIVATLAYAVTSLHTISVVKEQRNISYAADGAVNTAIQKLRNSSTEGANVAAGSACLAGGFSYTANNKTATVTCSVVSSRGPGQPGVNAPLYALQSVGTDASEVGILETTGGSQNKKIIVGGSIASSSPAVASTYSINVINLQAPGYSVFANGACNGTIVVTDPATDRKCNSGQTYADPGYPAQPLPSTSSAANFNPQPDCKAKNAAYEFSPGYYTDVDFLENPQNHSKGRTDCAAVEWFAPGVYFLDLDIDPTRSDAVWNMGGTIVGGEAKGWNPDSGTPNTGAALTGFSRWCKTEKDSATSGVQFVLGGNSQIANGSAIVELCASPSPTGTQQQIVIYGQKTGGTTSTATLTSTPSGTPTQQNSGSPAPTWTITNPTDPEAIERGVTPAVPILSGDTSSITGKNGANNPLAQLTLPGFTGVAVPAGGLSPTYDLQVSHQETFSNANDFSDLSVTIGTCKVTLTPSSTGTVEHPTLPACFAAAVASNFSAVYKVQASNNKTVSSKLDGIKVTLTYTPFVVRAQQGAVTTVNDPAAALSMTGNNTTFVMWGTVYLPLSKVVVDFKNDSVFEFRRGVIARTMQNVAVPPADTASSFCLGYGINCENGPARVFRLTATVDGSTKLVALVQVVDSPQLGASTKVWAWNVRKS